MAAQTKPISRPGSRVSKPGSRVSSPPVGSPYTMGRTEFQKTLVDRAVDVAQEVFEKEQPKGDYYIIQPDEFGSGPPVLENEQEEDGDPHVGGFIDTFANTGVGIGDYKGLQKQGKRELVYKRTLPLMAKWSCERAQLDSYPLYTHNPKYDNMEC